MRIHQSAEFAGERIETKIVHQQIALTGDLGSMFVVDISGAHRLHGREDGPVAGKFHVHISKFTGSAEFTPLDEIQLLTNFDEPFQGFLEAMVWICGRCSESGERIVGLDNPDGCSILPAPRQQQILGLIGSNAIVTSRGLSIPINP